MRKVIYNYFIIGIVILSLAPDSFGVEGGI